jgi:hypothetical protein
MKLVGEKPTSLMFPVSASVCCYVTVILFCQFKCVIPDSSSSKDKQGVP